MRGKIENTMDRRNLVLNWAKRKGVEDPLPPEFVNTAICMACGNERHINSCGFCEKCWVQFSHLRGRKWENEKCKK